MLDNTIEWALLLEQVRGGLKVHSHSARVGPGEVFVALSGSNRNGAAYIPQALQQGAGVIVSDQPLDLNRDLASAQVLIRANAAQALGELAAALYGTASRCYRLVGITGTNGKTTLCYALEHLLHKAGQGVGCLGTIAYRWPGHEQAADLTTPDCLQLHALLSRMQAEGVQTVCMEVSSHALEQQRTAGLDFDLAVFTNLTHDHLDYHRCMEDYFQAKEQLFFPEQGQKPYPVINLDDPYGRRLADRSGTGLGFAFHAAAAKGFDLLQGTVHGLSKEGLFLEMAWQGRHWHLQSPLLGRHNASNLLAVQAAGLCLGLSPEDMKTLEAFSGVPGRLERVEGVPSGHVFIDYAHTPDALSNVLRSIREIDFKRVIVVFGCGGNRDRQKRPLMGQVVALYADVCILTSDNPRDEDPLAIMQDVLPGLQKASRIIEEPDRAQAIALALNETGPEDALLIAGKGHETYQEIKGVRRPFSDKDEVLRLAGGDI